MCLCAAGFTGEPFSQCNPLRESIVERLDPCNPSPCGANAKCETRGDAGSCQCLPEYFGNPYEGCRPECVLNTDCPSNKACQNQKCVDPCPGTCGQNAECQVISYLPTCNCFVGHKGDPYRYCQIIREERKSLTIITISTFLTQNLFSVALPVYVNPCQPSPCGPNSRCRENSGQAVCSCLPEYVGSPPSCRPECTSNLECNSNTACVNRKCVDPCPGVCGLNAQCAIRNHSPICTCNNGYSGDAFVRCLPIPRKK